jgi:hypothetical protein
MAPTREATVPDGTGVAPGHVAELALLRHGQRRRIIYSKLRTGPWRCACDKSKRALAAAERPW